MWKLANRHFRNQNLDTSLNKSWNNNFNFWISEGWRMNLPKDNDTHLHYSLVFFNLFSQTFKFYLPYLLNIINLIYNIQPVIFFGGGVNFSNIVFRKWGLCQNFLMVLYIFTYVILASVHSFVTPFCLPFSTFFACACKPLCVCVCVCKNNIPTSIFGLICSPHPQLLRSI